ncbi:MAG: ABC transporter permease subunit [FCB group bacterium]|jgi:ABC-type transport system involved in multi-copper enzyme maturation permease subunit|nr:ABC transporter permease subunit [FCB group bacterium]
MIGRIYAAYQFELAKAIRMRSTYLGFILVALAVLAAPLLHHLHRDAESDYTFLVLATPATLNLLGVVVLLAYCAGLVASELGGGTARLALVRPILRHEFLFAKLLLGMTYAVALAVLVSVLAWGLVIVFGDLVGITTGGELVFTGGQVLRAYVFGLGLSMFPMFAAVAYALMISTFTRSSAAAITAALGIWFLADAVKYPLKVDQYLFTTYFEMPWDPFRDMVDHSMDPQWMPGAAWCVGISLATMAVCLIVSVVLFRRRNLAGC